MVFGEIIPQSVCSRYALRIGARSVPLVWVFVALCYVVAWPIAKILDWVLGREVSAVYTKSELQCLIKLNVEDPARQKESGLTRDDGKILTGALTFKDKSVEEAMTPIDSTFTRPNGADRDRPPSWGSSAPWTGSRVVQIHLTPSRDPRARFETSGESSLCDPEVTRETRLHVRAPAHSLAPPGFRTTRSSTRRRS